MIRKNNWLNKKSLFMREYGKQYPTSQRLSLL
jgi:hypothetical protein